MDQGPSASPIIPMAKPLLVEALGKAFLTYILAATESEIDEWLASGSDEFGSPQQNQALRELMALLQEIPQNDQPELRYLNLSRILGLYQEQFNTTLVMLSE